MLKLGEKIINNLYLGDKKIAKAFLGDKLIFQAGKPIFLDYIESTGTQYIDTGIKPSYEYTIKTKYRYVSYNSDYNCIFGTRWMAQATGNNIYWVGYNTNSKELMMRMGKTTTAYTLKLNEDVELIVNPNDTTVNGTSIGDAMYDGEIGFNLNILLFNLNETTSYFSSSARMYYFQIYDKDMNLIQDLRPCIDVDGIVCMYDMVTRKYFYNQGTGEFIGCKPIDIDYTRIYAYISSIDSWATAPDSYSILIPIEVGKKYRLEWEKTTSDVGTIFRYGQTNTPKPQGQILNSPVRTSPQDTPIADITAVNNYLVIQITGATASVVVENKYLKLYEIP